MNLQNATGNLLIQLKDIFKAIAECFEAKQPVDPSAISSQAVNQKVVLVRSIVESSKSLGLFLTEELTGAINEMMTEIVLTSNDKEHIFQTDVLDSAKERGAEGCGMV